MSTFKQKALEALRKSKNNSMECEGIEKAIMIIEDIENDGEIIGEAPDMRISFGYAAQTGIKITPFK